MTTTPEPKDKLDAMTTTRRRCRAVAVVNGPEDDLLDWDADRLADRRGGRTASAAADLHGVAGRGPQTGPQFAEVDAPVTRQHAAQRAAGHRAQRWPQDGGRRREGGVDSRRPRPNWSTGCSTTPNRGRPSPVKRVYIPKAQHRKAAPARHSRDRRPVPSGAGRQRVGTRVGGTVRAEVLRVPAGPWLPRRDRGHLPRRQGPNPAAAVGARRGPGGGVRPNRS